MEPQYPQVADCEPIHFTSVARAGPPQLGHVAGNKSARCPPLTGAAATGVTTSGLLGAGEAGGKGVSSTSPAKVCGTGIFQTASSTMFKPINIRMPGHQCPVRNRNPRPISQIAPLRELLEYLYFFRRQPCRYIMFSFSIRSVLIHYYTDFSWPGFIRMPHTPKKATRSPFRERVAAWCKFQGWNGYFFWKRTKMRFLSHSV